MLLEAKKTDFEYKNGDIYFGFGLFINLHLNKIYVLIHSPLLSILFSQSKISLEFITLNLDSSSNTGVKSDGRLIST